MTEREREINFTIQMIVGLLEQNDLVLIADLKKKALKVIDATTDKEYFIKAVE